uniref:ribosomal protein L33 n=1 Tax=Xyris pauciflora TaxID=2919642 RepID=UPI001F144199|nr:ribosomal protein L33 [Xyris pauciflora]ULQ68739.1 ribosomal protein L33 [Xyris pauciflora]
MVKGKDGRKGGKAGRGRIRVILECTNCVRTSEGVNKESPGVSRYITQKNSQTAPSRLELKKYCRYCRKHMIHGEIKK